MIAHTAPAQSVAREGISLSGVSTPLPGGSGAGPGFAGAADEGDSAKDGTRFSSSIAGGAAYEYGGGPLPSAPEPGSANPQREGVPWAAVWHQPPLSRIGVGADLSLLGIGIKVATPLNDHLDARALINLDRKSVV